MIWPKKCCILLLVAAIVAVALRLPHLAQRPMHTDEAVHAEKFRLLLEENFYRYDRHQYHGPTLYYLTLIPTWLTSATKLTDVTEFTLRIVPVFFGVLLVLLLLLLVDGLGKPAVVVAAVLTAVSPAMVFYSRYYIQEMLLVCFTFAVITFSYRYTQSKNVIWALLTGVFLGLMHATKETCIIAFSSMLLALLLTFLMRRRPSTSPETDTKSGIKNTKCAVKPWHWIAALTAAFGISALFFSSFFTNPAGILDSFRTYTTYFDRAGQNQFHIHPWHYYLKMLIYSGYVPASAWSEALIVILAVVGFIVAMTKKGISAVDFHLLRFIAFYTAVMTVLYSAIPYKTPWCLLGFLHGMILLAAVGAVAIVKLMPNVLARTIVILLLLAGAGYLTWQAYQGSYRYYADPRNPYVYAHTSNDVFTIARRVQDISQEHPDGRNMYIQVICPEGDYWPLPWYLRFFNRVAYQCEVDENMPVAPLIIASPSIEPALMKKLYELPPPGKRNMYVPLFDSYRQLRPQIELRGYVTKDLWDKYRNSQAQPPQPHTR